MSESTSVYKRAGEGEAFMTHPVSLLGAVALGIVLASSCAEAQTVHHRAHHPTAAGRQITVHEGVAPWLTAGTGASVGSRNAYVLDTLRPPLRNTVQGTFVGMRGNDRLPNQYSLPQSNRPLIIVSWPGSNEPLFSWY
jgi:hypothetical protein